MSYDGFSLEGLICFFFFFVLSSRLELSKTCIFLLYLKFSQSLSPYIKVCFSLQNKCSVKIVNICFLLFVYVFCS